MIAEYLDRSSLVARMKYYEEHTTEESGEHYAYSVALREIRNAPAADVAEVRHGRWIHHEDGVFTRQLLLQTMRGKDGWCSRMSGLRFESMADMPPRMRELYAMQQIDLSGAAAPAPLRKGSQGAYRNFLLQFLQKEKRGYPLLAVHGADDVANTTCALILAQLAVKRKKFYWNLTFFDFSWYMSHGV